MFKSPFLGAFAITSNGVLYCVCNTNPFSSERFQSSSPEEAREMAKKAMNQHDAN